MPDQPSEELEDSQWQSLVKNLGYHLQPNALAEGDFLSREPETSH